MSTELYGDDLAMAHKIALDMHAKSHAFIGNLCTFVTGFVQELRNTFQYGEEEVWELVFTCVQKLVEDLR
jgi:hypothetical protein